MALPLIGTVIEGALSLISGNQKRREKEIEIAAQEKERQDEQIEKVTEIAHEEKVAQIQGDAAYDVEKAKTAHLRYDDNATQIVFYGILIATFIPGVTEHVAAGWKAMELAPWWYEWTVIAIVVSSLGMKSFFTNVLSLIKPKIK